MSRVRFFLRDAIVALAATALVAAAGTGAEPEVGGCEVTSLGYRVFWKGVAGADYYELQMASSPEGHFFAALSTNQTDVGFIDVLPGTTYYFRLRAHSAGTPSLGPGTWGKPGPARECRTPGSVPLAPRAAARLSSMSSSKGAAAAKPETFTLEVMRESEYTYDVDYLMNHNAGDVLGDAAFLTFAGSSQKGGESFLNVTFENATFAVFCVDVLKHTVPDTTTTGGDSAFADYVSCNDNRNAKDPQCICDNWIDRVIGGMNPDDTCANRTTGDKCLFGPGHGHNLDECQCTCSAESLDYSAKYVGMMPVIFKGKQSAGSWYSFPAPTECREEESVGDLRGDGTQCTWKRRNYFRVTRGWEVMAQGWNSSSPAGGHSFDGPSIEQVHQNVAAVRRTLAAAPLQPWSCDASQHTKLLFV